SPPPAPCAPATAAATAFSARLHSVPLPSSPLRTPPTAFRLLRLPPQSLPPALLLPLSSMLPRSLPVRSGTRESSPAGPHVPGTPALLLSSTAPDLPSGTSVHQDHRCTGPKRIFPHSTPLASDTLALLPLLPHTAPL